MVCVWGGTGITGGAIGLGQGAFYLCKVRWKQLIALGPGPSNALEPRECLQTPSEWGQPAPEVPPRAKPLSNKIVSCCSSGLQPRGISQHGLASLLPLLASITNQRRTEKEDHASHPQALGLQSRSQDSFQSGSSQNWLWCVADLRQAAGKGKAF